MFIDETQIQVSSGRGGDGVVHFRREKYVPFGGPDGGDGGRGGDVILEVRPTLNTLSSFQHRRKYKAEDGRSGGGKDMTGRSGPDLVIPVPPGTVVSDSRSGEVLGDLVNPGERLVVCQGGRGGRGNSRFATSRNQAPRIAEHGAPAQERELKLELRLVADVGIVGAPNAGKSTLLAALTNAQPKIAAYPFTTLEPNLGVAILDEDTSLVLADIPGLIEGAHSGVGLGDAFLRHIQRTRVLIHLLDGTAEDPLLDYAQINSELALFDPDLGRKPQLVALNKIDQPEVKERWPRLEAEFRERLGANGRPLAISALARTNLTELLQRAARLLAEAPLPAPPGELPVYRAESDPRAFEIERESKGWRVRGAAIERAAAMTYWEYDQSIRRFQRILQTLGIDKALRKAGVLEGDMVFIGEYELEWQD
ncbi:MAG TPA: GTPase ObgE [Anaerolineales bacterium]|nr:GTPase ObgE [Anaerolineales bacterium]